MASGRKNSPSIGVKTNVSGTAGSISVLANNNRRKDANIYNDSGVTVYIDLSGGTASSTSFTVKLLDQDFYELPKNNEGQCYTGPITGLWASGSIRVTEFE